MRKTYTTVQGDMWDSIAYSKIGSVAYTDKLMRANQEHAGYYILPAGITLTLPDVDTTARRGSRCPDEQRKSRPAHRR